MPLALVSAIGFVVLLGLAWLTSSDRRRVPWRTIAWGTAFEIAIALLVFRVPPAQRLLTRVNDAVLALLEASKAGARFLLGPLAASPGEPGSLGVIILFQVLPIAIFFSAFTAVLYHLRILQVFVHVFARLFRRVLGTSGAESLASAANIFVGVEAALVVRPYLAKMTRSELLAVLTTGMASVASTTLGIYVSFLAGSFPQIAGHLVSASVLAIPAAVVMAKILVPETDAPQTADGVPPDDPSTRSGNLMGAVIEGSMDGLKLGAGISALLVAVLGLVALMDRLLALPAAWLGRPEPWTLVGILGAVAYPFAALLGISPADIPEAARLLGERAILTEVISYRDLAQMVASGQIADPRTVVVLSYALCGFAHVASVAIFVGGTASLAPSRRDDLAALGLRALWAATLATLATGCIAGMFTTGQGVLLPVT